MDSSPEYPYAYKDDPWSSHRVISTWLLALGAGKRVLDVGTAAGTLGRLCAGKGLVIDGIEPNDAWGAQAKPWYRRIRIATVEQALEQGLDAYDVIVLADVLEHLVDPAGVLGRMVASQPEGCLFMISVPNVANLWIRLNLLFGRFDYQERGILDRTHLRFFTWRSFRVMLQEAGLRVRDSRVTPIPLSLVHPFFKDRWPGRLAGRLLDGLTRLIPRLLGYQFVVLAAKNPRGVEKDGIQNQ